MLRHVELKLLNLLTSITRYQELGRRASWLARKVDFFFDIVILLLDKMLFGQAEQSELKRIGLSYTVTILKSIIEEKCCLESSSQQHQNLKSSLQNTIKNF